MSYPNLSQSIIEHSTLFFNQLDTQSTGFITMGDIARVCDEYNVNHPSYKPAESPFIPTIVMMENLTLESSISQEIYTTLQEKYPKLTASYSQIDTNSTGNILCSDLMSYYIPQPTVIESVSTSHYWIEYVKEHENLNDITPITLEQFLTYQNDYNFTVYFPLAEPEPAPEPQPEPQPEP